MASAVLLTQEGFAAVPITVDIASGWGVDPVDRAAELAEMGVAGVNIEDGRGDALTTAHEQTTLIRALKRQDIDEAG